MADSFDHVVRRAQEYLSSQRISGWLLYDYRKMNPVFWDTVGHIPNVTRPCWLWIPADGAVTLLVSYVDRGRFAHLSVATTVFVSRQDMTQRLAELLSGTSRVAMEYSPQGALPRVSRVDAGTLELVRGLGVEVVSSGDLLQHATQLWSEVQLQSHLDAAGKLTAIVKDAYAHIGDALASGPSEHDVAEFIRRRFVEEGLEVTDGPVVAVNEHASDPHFEPTHENAAAIGSGDWILIDLWSRLTGEDTMFADITWTAYVGESVPASHQSVVDAVVGARDAAVAELGGGVRRRARAARLGGGPGGQGPTSPGRGMETTSTIASATASAARSTATPSIWTAGRPMTPARSSPGVAVTIEPRGILA